MNLLKYLAILRIYLQNTLFVIVMQVEGSISCSLGNKLNPLNLTVCSPTHIAWLCSLSYLRYKCCSLVRVFKALNVALLVLVSSLSYLNALSSSTEARPKGSVFPCSLEKFPKSYLFPKVFFQYSLKGNFELLPSFYFDPYFPRKIIY